MIKTMHRREFLGTSAAAAAALAVPLAFADDAKKVSPSEKINVALIGCRGMGRADLQDFIKGPGVEVAALCDVDPRESETTIDLLKKPERPIDSLYIETDYRRIV